MEKETWKSYKNSFRNVKPLKQYLKISQKQLDQKSFSTVNTRGRDAQSRIIAYSRIILKFISESRISNPILEFDKIFFTFIFIENFIDKNHSSEELQ